MWIPRDNLLDRYAQAAADRPDALAYVDSFAIPDACLSAPIALENYIGADPINLASAPSA